MFVRSHAGMRGVWWWICWWMCSGWVESRGSSPAKRRDVYIAGFFPYGADVPEGRIGRGVMPAVKMAVDHINDSPTVLADYRLHMWWNDSQCNAAVGMKAFFDMMHEDPVKVMLFGPACTQVTDPIAKATRHWHLTQISYADTHPMFSRSNFPNFFRVVPSEIAFNAPRLKLLQKFNWTRVGTVYQNEPRYSLAHNKLVADLDSINYLVVETQSLTSDDVSSAIRKLIEKDIRIVLGNFNESMARKIFCEAFRMGMIGRKYQWLITGTYSVEWWTRKTDCSQRELEIALDGCIFADYLPLASSKVIAVSGLTPSEYEREYDSRRGSEYSRFHGYTYDGVWAAALAIQDVSFRIRKYRQNGSIGDFRYRDELWETLFVDALRNTSFEGVTGAVRFYDNERKANILLKQFRNGRELKVGEYNGISGELMLTIGHAITWAEGRGPPKDRTVQTFVHSHINYVLYFTLVVFAVIGILIALVFLAINVKYRQQKYIKMSSPHLNNLIIIGCILTYTSVPFLGLDSSLTSQQTFPYICTARAWILMAGFSLAFGAMFSKTWRVHSIFTDVSINKKVITDYQLFFVVGVLLVVDLGIMTTWQIADPFYRATKQMESYADPNTDDIQIIPVNEYCQSSKMTWFVGFIYAYKGLLMMFGAFLAWETRHVSIPALNDSKYVGMSVYNVVLMCVLGGAVSFVLTDQQNYSFAIVSGFIIFCTTTTLCLVFVPKIVELRRNPQGIQEKRMIRATLRPMSKRRDSSELGGHIKEATSNNQRCRRQIQEYDREIQLLLDRINARDNYDSPRIHADVQSTTEITELTSSTSSPQGQDIGTEHAHFTGNSYTAQRKKSSFSHSVLPSIIAEDTLSIIKESDSSRASISSPASSPPPQQAVTSSSPLPRIGNSLALAACLPTLLGDPRKILSESEIRRCSVPHASRRVCETPSPEILRRTSHPGKSNGPTTWVRQDELWLTQAEMTPRYGEDDNTPPEENKTPVMIQRSVSEKLRDRCVHRHHHHHHHHKHKQQQEVGVSNLRKPAPAYMRSTPNVLISTSSALSQGELLDISILPIFKKLISERKGAAVASCPDIAVKCDLVEYL